MEELEQLRQRMLTQRPSGWEQLPDLALYMDQLISYMPRQLIPMEEGDNLTSAMVNNYIKDGLLPRAEGKRYSKSHLALLTAICVLKPVMSMRDMAALFAGMELGAAKPGESYEFFLGKLDEALNRVAQPLPTDLEGKDLAALAFTLALDSYANKLACQRILNILGGGDPQPADGKKKK